MDTITLPALPRDLKAAAVDLGVEEVRYLVDTYYQIQEFRKATKNQLRSLTVSEEPHETIGFFGGQFELLEKQIQGALDAYSDADPLGTWARANYGIGPVITAGLLAHIDISKAPTVGHIWSFAGLDPSKVWNKGEKRPWNARLKVLCWKIGDSFVKFSNQPQCFYGHVYKERKKYEIVRDASGGNADAAKRTLETKNIHDKALKATLTSGHLPDGQLDQRARRYAVKLFLAHYHEAAYHIILKTEPPLPYPIAHLGHTHKIVPPIKP